MTLVEDGEEVDGDVSTDAGITVAPAVAGVAATAAAAAEDADEAATDAKSTIESIIPRDGIEFFFGLPFGFVGGTEQPPCITCAVDNNNK